MCHLRSQTNKTFPLDSLRRVTSFPGDSHHLSRAKRSVNPLTQIVIGSIGVLTSVVHTEHEAEFGSLN